MTRILNASNYVMAPPLVHENRIFGTTAVHVTADSPSEMANDSLISPSLPSPAVTQLRERIKSVFIVSFTIFVLANAVLSFSQALTFDPLRYIYRGWAWWTFNDLKHDKEIHNVALLGSSLMVSAVACTDANYLHKNLDLTAYHRAAYLDKLLATKFDGEFNTFNLSAPGQMPSDAYLTLKAMVNISQRPEFVIYAVAPRDFIDSTLTSPVDTEPYHFLSRVVSVDDVASGLFRSPLPRLDWFLQKCIYLYGYSLDFRMQLQDIGSKVISHLVPQPATDHPFTWWDRKRLLPSYLPGDIIAGSMIAGPADPKAASKFIDNTAEYKDRYHKPNARTYKTQFYFLRKLAAFCKREKIELVLVNMPLTQQNIALLKPQIYLNYVQALRQFGFDQNIKTFNMMDFELYRLEDYHDTVHMNGFGGKKFFDRLVSVLAGDTTTATVLKLIGQEQAEALAAAAKSASSHVTTVRSTIARSADMQSATKQSATKQSATKQSATKQSAAKQSTTTLSAAKQSATARSTTAQSGARQ